MRDQTEWLELIAADVNILTGANEGRIIDSYKLMVNKQSDFSVNLYGSGKAAINIAESLATL